MLAPKQHQSPKVTPPALQFRNFRKLKPALGGFFLCKFIKGVPPS